MLNLKSPINVGFYIGAFKKFHEDATEACDAFQRGLSHFKHHEFSEAISAFKEALSSLQAKVGEGKSMFEGHFQRIIGNSYYLLGNLELAIEHLDKAITIYTNLGSATRSFLVETLDIIAEVYLDDLEFEDAEEKYNQSIEIQEKALGLDHFDLAELYIKRARILLELNVDEECLDDLNKAERILEANKKNEKSKGLLLILQTFKFALEDFDAAVKKRKEALEYFDSKGDLLMVAYLANELGQTDNYSLDDPLPEDELMDYLERARQIYADHFGEKSFKVCNVIDALAVGKQNLEQYEAAKELYLKELEIMEGSNNTLNKRSVYQNLGACELQLANFEEAIKYYDLALKTFQEYEDIEKIADDDVDDMLELYQDIGEVYYFQNLREDCLKWYQKGVDLVEKRLEKTGVAIPPSAYERLGRVLLEKSDYKKGLEYLDKAIQLSRDLEENERDNEVFKRSLDLKGQVLIESGDYDGAIAFFQECIQLELKEEDGNEKSEFLVPYYGTLALALAKKGGLTKALETITKAENIIKELKLDGSGEDELSTNYPLVLIIYGYILIMQGKPNEAIPKLESSIPLIEQLKSKSKVCKFSYDYEYSEAFAILGFAQGKAGDYENSIKNLTKGIEIKSKVFGEEHADIGRFYYYLGLIYKSKKEYQNAFNAFEKSTTIGKKLFGEDHPEFSEAEFQMNLMKSQLSKDQ